MSWQFDPPEPPPLSAPDECPHCGYVDDDGDSFYLMSSDNEFNDVDPETGQMFFTPVGTWQCLNCSQLFIYY